MRTTRFALIIALLVTLSMAHTACFAAATSTIHVSATVLPWVNFNAEQHVISYRVTDEDLKRGYIDLPASVTVHLKTNVKKQVAIFVQNTGSERIAIRLAGSGRFLEDFVTINSAEYKVGEMISSSMDTRVIFSGESKEGTYTLNIPLTLEI